MPVPTTQGVHRRDLLRDRVHASLRDAIVDGTLAPGEQLRDADLEAWLGVSRTPIREALQRLEQAGLVTTRPGRSTTVTPIDSEATRHARQLAAGLQELAVRLAVPHLTGEDVTTMREANSRFAAALAAQDTAAALTADDDFHAVALRAAGNPLVRAHFEQVSPLLRRVELRRFGSRAGHASVEQHERVVEACAAGDVEAAARAVRENWHSLEEG
ncbi:GntR family transcriptional regulator [Paenibacillus sp. TRM 82003]|uniref:GntR family transcriptional regulator n=1 Tax=Kineococcus sp. TRM81007 TaxID=2925831 RepID=UPI001F59F1E5|nr:GntR family transcriptional regulator [Kineococcus sp. TRM81007]MCI2238234.1 GntR family transcriptional regulator [Kineococcus sp. TRM81007]MCI3924094.1 GntR family transcriptional regulator [Paenibacillus sp. TRM 82003]